MGCPDDCLSGRVARFLAPTNDSHVLGEWTLNGKVYEKGTGFDRRDRPCLVLAARRHVGDLPDLTPTERRELGELLPMVHADLLMQSGAQNVFVLYLNPHREHVHIHLVPNYEEDLGRPGQVLMEKELPPCVHTADGAAIATAIAIARATS